MEIVVNSKSGLSSSVDNLLNSINDAESNVSSKTSSLSGVSDCDGIQLSAAAQTIINNFDAIFQDFLNVANSANNYITNLIAFDIDDFPNSVGKSPSSTGKQGISPSGSDEMGGYQSYSSSGNSGSNYSSSSTDSNSYGGTSSGKVVDESIIQSAEGTEIILPSGLGSVRTYMGWQCITNTESTQYKLMQTAGMNFDEEGFGIIGDRYVVATTDTYGVVGDYIDVYQEDGSVLNCIIGDIKNQNDAGCNKWGHLDGQCVVESVVDKSTWYSGGYGDHANPGTASCHPEWDQNITKIVNKGNYFDFIANNNV